jgi:MoaA/NifB/PqqE/SkfB family radical SAM enzyme
LRAIDAALGAGLSVLLNTVVTKQRFHSHEFIDFLEFTKNLGVGVVMMLAKPAGSWEGNSDILLNEDDLAHVRELEKHYNAFTHLVPAYGLDLGCIAVKRMVSITKYGDVMPCPWIHISLGNFFDEPLKNILERGMKIKFFGKRMETCLGSVDGVFLRNYIDKMIGKPFPGPYSEIFTGEDFLE